MPLWFFIIVLLVRKCNVRSYYTITDIWILYVKIIFKSLSCNILIDLAKIHSIELIICWFKTINIQIPFETTKYQCNCQFRGNKKTYVPILSMVGLRQRCWELKRTICSTIDNLWRVVTIFSTTKFYYINNLAPIFNRQSPCLDSAWKFKFRLVLAAHKYCKYKSHERRVCM